jgi:hypothetical protein
MDEAAEMYVFVRTGSTDTRTFVMVNVDWRALISLAQKDAISHSKKYSHSKNIDKIVVGTSIRRYFFRIWIWPPKVSSTISSGVAEPDPKLIGILDPYAL